MAYISSFFSILFFFYKMKKHIFAEKKSYGQSRRCRSASAGPAGFP